MALSFPIFWTCPVCLFKDFDAGSFVDVANCVGDGPESGEGRELKRAVFIDILGGNVLLGRVVLFQFCDVVVWGEVVDSFLWRGKLVVRKCLELFSLREIGE